MKVMLSYFIIFLAFSKLHDKFLSDQNRRLPTYLSIFYERSDENLSNIVQTQTWPPVRAPSTRWGVAALHRPESAEPLLCACRATYTEKSTKQARIRIRTTSTRSTTVLGRLLAEFARFSVVI